MEVIPMLQPPLDAKDIELNLVTNEWKEAEYAIYHYTPNRETLAKSDTESRTVGAGFRLEHDRLQSRLSLVGSSICSDREHLLREHVGVKMSQITLYKFSGLVTSMDPDVFPPPSQCYINKIECSSGESQDRQYLLCFVCIGKQGLDLFRNELDVFCVSLSPLVESLPLEDTAKLFVGSVLENKLSAWFLENVDYLVRVVQLCQEQLPVLLHIAVDSPVEVVGADAQLIKYVKMFLEACSLANLMQLDPPGDDSSGKKKASVKVHVSEKECTVSSKVSSRFCVNWSQVLLSQGTSSPDSFFLRHAIENYKLKIIQDINALKRLLRQAESNYHALYRCYAFLCACGNGDLLLQCSIQEANTLDSSKTLAVLDALQTFSKTNPFT